MTPVPPGPYLPTSALVAVAWIGSRVSGITADMVATKLPRDLTRWADLGFVQATVLPGSPDIDTGARMPVVQIDTWAHSPEGVKPPVGKATRLAELIVRATENDVQTFGQTLSLGPNFLPVRVQSVYPATEPSEVPDDPSGFARVTLDLAITWVRA